MNDNEKLIDWLNSFGDSTDLNKTKSMQARKNTHMEISWKNNYKFADQSVHQQGKTN